MLNHPVLYARFAPAYSQAGETMASKFINDKTFVSFQYSDDPSQHPGKVFGYIPYMSADGSDIPYYSNDNAKGTQVTEWANIVINAKTRYPELAVKLVDFQYSREMLDLFNWGVEGVTYRRNADGSKQFTDEIMRAANMTVKMAEYGINTSYSVRSGIQFVPQDRDVAVATMSQVPSYIDGNFNQTRSCWKYYDEIEQAGKAKQYPLNPPVSFTADQQTANARIITAVNTYTDEYLIKFITGEISLDYWDRYLAEMKNFGDMDQVLDNYNSQL
jgi:putative aldouronate transport system substrate-binding protein